MQSCWLPPSQRPSVAEVFLLLSSLLAAERGMARGSVGEEDEEDEEYEEGRGRRGESEESFERRWDLLRPSAFQTAINERQRERDYIRDERNNSYPLLDPVGNCTTPSSSELDDILTVTETSKGLNFEYFWEKAHARRGYKPLPPPQPIPTVNSNHRQSLDTPTVVPVISARSPSLASEYYIRLEEHTPQDKSPTLKGKAHSSYRSDSKCMGDMELVEIRSGMLGKERVPYCSSDTCGKGLQIIKSSEIQLQVPNTGVAEFRDSSSRVTDFSVVDLGDDEEEDRKKSSEADKKSSCSQAPVLPPKPRSMSMSSANHLHSRPLPAPPLAYRGLPHYSVTGKIETDPHHMSSCPTSTFEHLGLHRTRQALPPSPSLSPSLPPSSHPIYPQPPQMCPPPLPPHCKPQKGGSIYNTADAYSKYSKLQTQKSSRDPLSCDLTDRENSTRHSVSSHNSKETSHSRVKDFESPIRRENPLRPIYRSFPRPEHTKPQLDRQSSSSPTYSDEDDSPFMSPERVGGGTTIAHSSLSEDADPACADLFSRGMKRTQSRLDTILPTIWKEDAELQAERVAAAKKSPMHLFLTEISSVTGSSEGKSETLWEVDKEEKRDGERWGNFVLPNKGMRRSQSLITELGSSGQSWGQEKSNTKTEPVEDNTVTKESFQGELFLTEIDTGEMVSNLEKGSENDSVKYLYPSGSRLRPYVCAPGLPSYTEAEEAYSKGIRRSRSLLAEISIGKQESESQPTEKEPQRTEMTREEFLKEIQSAETFLTEIISRQNAATNKKEADLSHTPTPLSPEYESICIDPNSAQTITFQSGVKGSDDKQTEAIYAQVTKRAKKSEIKVSMKPEIPILHIGSNKQHFKVEGPEINADHCQSGQFVFSEIMPKNGLLHNQREVEDCSDGPALPARGPQLDILEDLPLESSENTKETKTVQQPGNKLQSTNITGNGEFIKDQQTHNTEKEGQTCEKADDRDQYPNIGDLGRNCHHTKADNFLDKFKNLPPQNNDEILANTKGQSLPQHGENHEETNCHMVQKVPITAGTPSTPEWDPSSDASIVTPTDSVLSPMTSSSADCLTPSDSWQSGGGGVGNGGWRALGNETPHRDSAYFSDSDWEGDGMSRRSSDGLMSSRPSSGRGGERGTLTGIEEKTEEEGEMGEKSPLGNIGRVSVKKSDSEEKKATDMGQDTSISMLKEILPESDTTFFGDDRVLLNKGLVPTQRDDSGIFPSETKKTSLLCDDLQTKDCVDLIDKLLLNLDEDQLKGLQSRGGYQIDNHLTDGIISKISECNLQDSVENDLNVHFKMNADTNIIIKSEDCGQINNSGISSTQKDSELSALNSLICENYTRPSSPLSQSVNSVSRSSQLNTLQLNDAKFCDEALSSAKSSDEAISSPIGPSWTQTGPEEAERNEGRSDIDHNELGLRNLCCPDGSEDNKVTAKTETQLVASELRNALKEKSPLRGASSPADPSNNTDTDTCEGLDVKTKELWIALEEDEGSNAVRGEFDCHRFAKAAELHLWPDENDQWASPERKCRDSELKSEFFPGFSNKAWEFGERLIVGQEFWENEENDELAGSEPHPDVLGGSGEESWNDEKQGLTGNLAMTQKWDTKHGDCQIAVQEGNVQQEENNENLEDTGSIHIKREVPDFEVENKETPESEALERGEILPQWETVHGLADSTETQENQNFNSWPLNDLSKVQIEEQTSAEDVPKWTSSEVENNTSVSLENTCISVCVSQATVNISEQENAESCLDSVAAVPCMKEKESILNKEVECKDASLTSNQVSCSAKFDTQVKAQQAFEQVDNFSSVDFPSPPPSVDLDVQDDKLESLDDSFPSPPPSVVEEEESTCHIDLEDFSVSAETEAIFPDHNTDASEPLAVTQSIGISANLNLPTVQVTPADDGHLTPCHEEHDGGSGLLQSTSSDTTSSPQVPVNNLPELLISEWKDLDEECLEDFEKLEQLCCISGDEEESLGDLFLGNLELLESLKKTPDQKGVDEGDGDLGEMDEPSDPDNSRMDLKEDSITGNSDEMAEFASYVILEHQDQVPHQEENNDGQRSPVQTVDVKDHGSLSKMTTKNGLMMQVNVLFSLT